MKTNLFTLAYYLASTVSCATIATTTSLTSSTKTSTTTSKTTSKTSTKTSAPTPIVYSGRFGYYQKTQTAVNLADVLRQSAGAHLTRRSLDLPQNTPCGKIFIGPKLGKSDPYFGSTPSSLTSSCGNYGSVGSCTARNDKIDGSTGDVGNYYPLKVSCNATSKQWSCQCLTLSSAPNNSTIIMFTLPQ